MDLNDALGGWPAANNQQAGGSGPWPSQPTNPAWPGQPANPTWPGGQSGGGGAWPSQPNQPGQPNQPAWPGQPSQPSWPGQPSQPSWPGQPSQPSQPNQPAWPYPHPSAPGGWPTPSPGSAPQQSLIVPYQQNLPQGVYDKLLITIAGTIKPNANKITVDLSTDNDLAFHFNPRFNENGKKVIVRNTCIGKQWGREERELKNFPFVPGQQFEIKILCTTHEYKVAVNNSHLLTYQHRITDLRSIKKLHIYNDLTLSKVHFESLP